MTDFRRRDVAQLAVAKCVAAAINNRPFCELVQSRMSSMMSLSNVLNGARAQAASCNCNHFVSIKIRFNFVWLFTEFTFSSVRTNFWADLRVSSWESPCYNDCE